MVITKGEIQKRRPASHFLFHLGLMIVHLGLMGLWMLYGLWGAWRAFQGRDFRYIVLDRMLERYMPEERRNQS
jgi:hypothetical protein